MALNLLHEFDQELYDWDEDEVLIPTPELDANGNWHYSFSFDDSDIIYVVWNEDRVFQNGVQVGIVCETGIYFFPRT